LILERHGFEAPVRIDREGDEREVRSRALAVEFAT
jgi:hypothetical protein